MFGDETGDFCSDTPPTPTNFGCSDPTGSDGCSGEPWAPTDFHNYMSYTPDFCRDNFTAQQMGRTQCWFESRLTGWLGASPRLIFSYPDGLPFYMTPGQAQTFQMRVAGAIGVDPLQNSGKMFVSTNGGGYSEVPITVIGANLYEATLTPPAGCGDTLDYYFTAMSTDLEEYSDPVGAPDDSFQTVSAFGSRVVYSNNFDGNTSGWTITNDPLLTTGGWELADPIGTRILGMDAAPDTTSGTSLPNVLAWVTQNGTELGVADDADVDDGSTVLTSPVFDLSAGGGTISYSRWFFTTDNDLLTVEVTNDGNNWVTVEAVGGQDENRWTTASFRVADFVSPSATVQVRFHVADDPDDSITEAAIDLFRVEELVCTACVADAECQGPVFCNGEESCVGGFCQAGSATCAGQICDESNDICVDCFIDADCDDGIFCNGTETCDSPNTTCLPGTDPCPGFECNDDFDVCINCLVDEECSDGLFCNGVEVCNAPGYCSPPVLAACPAFCDEDTDDCIGNVEPQPHPGQPLRRLSEEELDRFEKGEAAFAQQFDVDSGLGPVYNASSCSACHNQPQGGGSGTVSETRFGFDDGAGGFDPLTELGGSLLQSQALSPSCLETMPPEANMTSPRLTTSALGSGLIESIADTDLQARAIMPPAGVSGQAHMVTLLEDPGDVLHVGRFGWKSQHATVVSASGDQALYQLGITNRLIRDETAPNGDEILLGQCDDQPDPEDFFDIEGFDFLQRVTDYQRFLAPPPQTPRSGMNGEVWFGIAKCADCHTKQFITADLLTLEDALRNKVVQPFSDFLLHDMGSAGEPTAQGDAGMNEVRTPPLWGLRYRDRLWHDGSIGPETYPTFEDRIDAAVTKHGEDPASEGAALAAAWASLPPIGRDVIIAFLGTLGRLEFDMDGDNDVDAADYPLVLACYTGPGSFYDTGDACAVADIDQDGDVDDDDLELLDLTVNADAGRVPDGFALPGDELIIGKAGGDQITLSWGDSCLDSDNDYAVYEGCLGDHYTHTTFICTTGGDTTATFNPFPTSTYYIVVPNNGLNEGSYGTRSNGQPRPVGVAICLPSAAGACE